MSVAQFSQVKDMEMLRLSLSGEAQRNAANLHAIFESPTLSCHSTTDFRAVVAVSGDEERVVLAGNWSGVELPMELLPEKDFFLPACLPEAMALVRRSLEVKEEWPCWYYLASESYGPGPWDDLGPLTMDDVEFVARFWQLSDDPVVRLRERIAKYDSACVRKGGKPVSWTGLHYETEGYANLGFAHTLEGHRRRGYASMVTKALVNRLAVRGFRATCHVIKDNAHSIGLCETLGFQRVGEATWAVVGRGD